LSLLSSVFHHCLSPCPSVNMMVASIARSPSSRPAGGLASAANGERSLGADRCQAPFACCARPPPDCPMTLPFDNQLDGSVRSLRLLGHVVAKPFDFSDCLVDGMLLFNRI